MAVLLVTVAISGALGSTETPDPAREGRVGAADRASGVQVVMDGDKRLSRPQAGQDFRPWRRTSARAI